MGARHLGKRLVLAVAWVVAALGGCGNTRRGASAAAGGPNEGAAASAARAAASPEPVRTRLAPRWPARDRAEQRGVVTAPSSGAS